MDSHTIVLPNEILDIIWKTYYSQYVLPIIQNQMESQLYLDKLPTTYNFAMNPSSYQPYGIYSKHIIISNI